MSNATFAQTNCAVLLAAYNGIEYIEQQVHSILTQSGVNVTLFVSVDLSTDGTKEYFDNLSAQHSNVILLPYGQKYGSAGRNFFRLLNDVDASAFDYFSLADQDDIWNIDKLFRAITLLKQSDYSAYSSNVIAFWPEGHKKLIKKNQPQRKWDYYFEAAGPGCTYVFTQELMISLQNCLNSDWNSIQKVSFHDWFIYAFARAKGFKWFIDAKPSMQYRQHANNVIGARAGVHSYITRFKKIMNGWWLGQSLMIAGIINQNDEPFVKSWRLLRRAGLVKLAFQARKCRREVKAQLFFFVAVLCLALKG